MDRSEKKIEVSGGGELAQNLRHPSRPPLPQVPSSEWYYSSREPASGLTIAGVIRRRIWTILTVLVSTLIATAVATRMLPVEYESSTTILVDAANRTGNGTTQLDVLERVGRAAPLETELELLTSRRVITPVVEELDLNVVLEVDGVERDARATLPSLVVPSGAVPGSYRIRSVSDGRVEVADALADTVVSTGAAEGPLSFAGMSLAGSDLAAGTEVILDVMPEPVAVEAVRDRFSAETVSPDADLIRVTCRGGTAEGARDLCNALTEEFLELRTGLQRSEALAAAGFLREQVELVRARLAEAEDSLEAFGRRNEIVALGERASGEVRQLTALTADRDQVAAERTALSGLIGSIESRSGQERRYRDLAAFPTFLQNQSVSRLFGTLLDLEDRRGELALRRGDENPDIIALDARIRETELELYGFARSYETALAQQVRSLDGALSAAGDRLTLIPGQQVQYSRLERQTALLSELYQYLETRRREAEVAEAVDLPTVRVLDPAILPVEPAGPSMPRNLALGLLLGLAGGGAMGLYRELSDRSLHARQEVELETGLPVLSVIPSVRRPGPILECTAERPRRRSAHDERRQDIAREAFMTLLSDLVFAARPEESEPMRSVAVTSAGAGEGKTFTACNLALAQAALGSRVLLIDADLRARGTSRFFDVPTLRGLNELLTGELSATEVIRPLGIDDPRMGRGGSVSLLQAGKPTPRSVGLLQDEQFTDFLAWAQKRFDLVVVDTPPLNVLSDAMAVAVSVDEVLVVVRGGVTDRESLALTVQRLSRSGVKIAGVVLNDVPIPRDYGKYSYVYTQAVLSE